MRPENSGGENGNRIVAVAIGIFRDEQVVADQHSVAFMDPDGMLKGWNSKVRITSAISSA